ncbi:MAG: zinc ribbon domain-containing protein [Tissierellia bacterium]|nr:zinc ribbon domain-containing protein [Tissierellia bacterium]
MKCKFCGKEVPEAKFCSECGAENPDFNDINSEEEFKTEDFSKEGFNKDDREDLNNNLNSNKKDDDPIWNLLCSIYRYLNPLVNKLQTMGKSAYFILIIISVLFLMLKPSYEAGLNPGIKNTGLVLSLVLVAINFYIIKLVFNISVSGKSISIKPQRLNLIILISNIVYFALSILSLGWIFNYLIVILISMMVLFGMVVDSLNKNNYRRILLKYFLINLALRLLYILMIFAIFSTFIAFIFSLIRG